MGNTHDADVLQLSASQRRLWFLTQMDTGGTAWNLQLVFRLRGRLDCEAIERSLGDLIARHESLRTTFQVGDDGEPVQLIWPYSGYQLPYVDLLAEAGNGDRDEAVRWAERQWRQPYDITKGPLMRTALLRVAPDDHHLVVDLHHLVADAWSVGILYRELCSLYAARACGQSGLALPELPVQYGDFVVWEAARQSGPAMESALAIWLRRLGSAPAPATFPGDHPGLSERSATGDVSTVSLPPPLVTSLRRLSAEAGVSLFMVMLAAFDVMLMRYSGEEDLVVGSAAPSRVHPDIEGLIGCFVNPLALRTDLSGSPTFREVLAQVRDTVLEAYENQHVSFDRLVAELKPERSDVTRPFFRTLMQSPELGVEPARAGDLDIEMVGFSSEAAGIDLAVALVEEGSALTAVWEYDSGLYEAATIERMQRHYLTLLESAVAVPDSPIWTMRMLSEDEERQLAPAPSPARQGPFLHHLVESRARSAPGATAVTCGPARLSYGELNTRANQLARILRAEGVGPETVVGVCLPRGLDLPVVLLAVLKAGGCYLPLDPGYPPDRLVFMIEDSGASLVIGDDPGLPARVLPLAPLAASASRLDGTDQIAPDLPRQAAAYVIYTSGSTGKPKGVQVPHAGLANLAQAQLELFGLTAEDRVGQFFSLNFDGSVFEIAMAWVAGAVLVVPPVEDMLPGSQLAGTFREAGVTAVTMTPTALTALGPADIPTLRIVSAAGEACPPGALRPWLDQARCFNLYGPTEATVWSTSGETGAADETAGALPIGIPISGASAYVLDPALNPVPNLVTGELYVGGAGITRGYLGRPRLTAERFLPDPFAVSPGSRMYATGDQARRRSDGRLEFLGRVDDQVKIRGYRIELGEVEAVVGGCPLVRQCAAVADESRLICHVVPEDADGPVTAEQIRAYAAETLPGYLIPDLIVFCGELPTLPSGKTDRKALIGGSAGADGGAAGYVAPRTPMEEFMAAVWAELLHVPQVSVNDDFFAMGGHSLAATLVVTKLKADLGLEIPVTLLFEHQVLENYTRAVLDYAGETDSEFTAAP